MTHPETEWAWLDRPSVMVDTRSKGSPKGLPALDSTSGLHQLIGRDFFDGSFPLPTMVLRDSALRHNIDTMARFCSENGVLLAPHAKTTMSPELLERQLAGGAWGMTVATAWQAAQVAAMGVDRIILANEVVDPGSLGLLSQTLRDHPGLTLWTYIDSMEGLQLLGEHVSADHGRLRLLIELGIPGARTGVRTAAEALALAHAAAGGPHSLAGVGAFEGVIGGADSLAEVDEFLQLLAATGLAMEDAGLFGTNGLDANALVTAGGSAFPDRVAAILRSALQESALRIVVRSGCYLTHDCGTYRDASPFGTSQRVDASLVSAIEVWAPVLSRPEPGRVIAGLGRRDVSFDSGLPVVLGTRSAADSVLRDSRDHTRTVVALNDQHAFIDVDPADPIAIGDLASFGISHPCTTFDKWHAIPIVDDDYRVVDIATTRF